MDFHEQFKARQRAFEDEVRRANTSELEGMLRYGRLTVRNWQADIIFRELKRRQEDGEPIPSKDAGRSTAWAKILDDKRL